MTTSLFGVGAAVNVSVNGTLVPQVFTAVAGQTVFTLTNFQYTINTNSLLVWINGQKQRSGTDFAETSSSSLTFIEPLLAGDVVDIIGIPVVNLTQSNAGAVTVSGAYTLTSFINDSVPSVTQPPWLTIGDGVVDDHLAIQAALNSLGALGGTVRVPNGKSINLGTASLTIPINCHLVGPHNFLGTPGNNASAPYGQLGGKLLVKSTATINVSAGASIRGFMIQRQGMIFPAADSSLFAGTGITIIGDDAAVERCAVFGFSIGILSNGFQRPKINNIIHDNINGIEIANCADIPYVNTCHAWPFTTIATGAAALKDTRSGLAYYLHDLVDWGKLTDCFSWGYLRGFRVFNASSCTLLNCGADNLFLAGAPAFANSIGCDILGTSQDTRLIGFQAAANATAGVNVSTAAGLSTQVLSLNVWGGSSHGILVDGGDVQHIGGCLRSISNGVSVTNAVSRVYSNGIRFESITGSIYFPTVVTGGLYIGPQNDYYNAAAGTAVVGTNAILSIIASAATIALFPSEDMVSISGVTGIANITGGHAKRLITLNFTGILTVTHGTGSVSAIRLSGAVNFITTNGGTLTLRHNGSFWVEVGRSA